MRNSGLPYLFVALLLMSGAKVDAQALEKLVTLEYNREQLGEVLADISNAYDVSFAYSRDFIPVEQPVSVFVVNQPLSQALDDLFKETPVIYRHIGGQVVLKIDENKNSQLSQIETIKLPKSVPQMSPIYPVVNEEMAARRAVETKRMQPIRRTEVNQLPGGNRFGDLNAEEYIISPDAYKSDEDYDDRRLAQISLLPFLGTNAMKSYEMTNNFSVNVLWGTNGGVDGLEVGGMVNTIRKDVRGVQVAGFGNTVGGDVVGTQASGFFNVSMGRIQGVQAAGLFNISGEADAVQAAGLFNATKDGFSGLQAAGLFNISGGNAQGLQASGLFNYSEGETRSQVSGLFNAAGDVEWGQISAIINVAKKVNGFQVGLINVADTVSGVPVGLLNFIRKGYNRVEFSGNETLHANFGLKLGARSFYNIIHLGARWDDLTVDNVLNSQSGIFMSWGIGYGIGVAPTIGSRTLMNVEVVAIHVNEYEAWTNELNLLSQLRLLMDVRVGQRTSMFAGPVANIMVSKLYDPETGIYGSSIVPYTLYDETNQGTSVKGWIGFNAGVRF